MFLGVCYYIVMQITYNIICLSQNYNYGLDNFYIEQDSSVMGPYHVPRRLENKGLELSNLRWSFSASVEVETLDSIGARMNVSWIVLISTSL